ncbi:MAG: hypothetical protein PSV18_12780 [Methylobacter sp.]|uniref:Uncharacterized protein n=1 Tax=Candidatus Methylobacter titanis TaxID=3053457 RepID=A0AA43Q3E7_9GAMM|nr:hypothetical protein [Candidatus Methylobacter titanis]MDI1293605.1 hypothetical protein [Candidatus Methylobacter titanis]
MNKKNLLSLLSNHHLFALRLLLSLLGAYIGYSYRHTSHDYWFVMMFLFTVIAIAPGYYQFKQHGDNLKALTSQLLHWTGGLGAAIVVYAYHSSGRIFHEEAGLIVLLILALTTYLDGIQTGWRGIFTGLFLGLITVCVAYLDGYIWQLAVLAIAAITISYHWNSDVAS